MPAVTQLARIRALRVISTLALSSTLATGAAFVTSTSANATTSTSTVASASPLTQRVTTGTSTVLRGHLARPDGTPVAGQPMWLYVYLGSNRWSLAHSFTTNTNGDVAFRFPAGASHLYTWRHPSTYGALGSWSQHMTVYVTPALGAAAVREASRHYGAPYQWGAAGPYRFDCSGFTMYVYGRLGKSLPHSSSAQYADVRHIAPSQMQPGDLIFFHDSSGYVYHVGIYAGSGKMWAATHTGDVVRYENVYSNAYYVGRVG